MRKLLLLILLLIVFFAQAQKVSTQQFIVRKITFKTSDQIIPVNGVFVEINKVKFKSNSEGSFTANIPVTKDMGFFISKVTAPGYILSIPEDLTKKLHLSSDPIVIVLADINAVKVEREKIVQNNKKVLERQESKIKEEVQKNQILLDSLKNKNEEYVRIAEDLEVVKRQLAVFQEKKDYIEAKIDSIADVLSLIDVVSLSIEEQKRVEKEKNGEWIDALTDQLLSKIDERISSEYETRLTQLNHYLQIIADEYYKTYIKESEYEVADYFIDNYRKYVWNSISEYENEKKSKAIDKLLSIMLDEEVKDIVNEHVQNYKSDWKSKVKSGDKNIKETNLDVEKKKKTCQKAKTEFLSIALYSDRAMQLDDLKSLYRDIININPNFLETYSKAHPVFFQRCQTIATDSVGKYLKEYKAEDYFKLSKEDWFEIHYSIERTIETQDFFKDSKIVYDFKEDMRDISVINAMNVLAEKNNFFVDEKKTKIMNAEYEPIYKKIKSLDSEKKCQSMLKWEKNKYDVAMAQTYDQYKNEYKQYLDFLYPIVMVFINPIEEKYNTDDALYVWENSLINDMFSFCREPIRDHYELLIDIDGIKGGDKCWDIIQAIIAYETIRLIDNHNNRYSQFKQREKENENNTIQSLKRAITAFATKEDVVAYLITHTFKCDNLLTWYDADMSKFYMDDGKGPMTFHIKYFAVQEWNENTAKIKIYVGELPIIVTIKLNGSNSKYIESIAGENREYGVVEKE